MDSLVVKYIKVDSVKEWLIKALLELILNASNIDDKAPLLICPDGSSIIRQELNNKTDFCLPSFLLGIWHYLIVKKIKNGEGKDTYNEWYKCSSVPGSLRHLDVNIGDAISQPIILLPCSEFQEDIPSEMEESSEEYRASNVEDESIAVLTHSETEHLLDNAIVTKNKHTNPRVLSIPFLENSHFIDRPTFLTKLGERLAINTTNTNAPAIQTLCGLGGFGKTQIALKYVYSNLKKYDTICWVECTTKEAMTKSCTNFLHIVEEFSAINCEARFNHWFQTNENWLLVFDDVSETVDINYVIPKIGQGHIIFTTRETSKHAIHIEALAETEAVDFLLQRTGNDDFENAKKIAIRLGCFPLALEQAAAYIADLDMSLADYYDLLCKYKLNVFNKNESNGDYKWNVQTVWEITLEKLSESSKMLLYCFAYMSADNLMLTWLVEYAREQQEPNFSDSFAFLEEVFSKFESTQFSSGLISLLTDDIALNVVKRELKRFSLVSEKADKTLIIHSLTQEVIRNGIHDPSYMLSVGEMLSSKCSQTDLIYPDYRVAISLKMAKPIISNIKVFLDYCSELEKSQNKRNLDRATSDMKFQLYSFLAQFFVLSSYEDDEKKTDLLEEADYYYNLSCTEALIYYGGEKSDLYDYALSSTRSFTLIQEKHRRMHVNLMMDSINTATKLYEEAKEVLIYSMGINPGMVEQALENYGDLWKKYGFFEKAKEAYELARTCKIEKHKETLQAKIADCDNR